MKRFSKIAVAVATLWGLVWGFLKVLSTLVSIPDVSVFVAGLVEWVQAQPVENVRLAVVAALAVAALALGYEIRGKRRKGPAIAACLAIAGGIALVASLQDQESVLRPEEPIIGIGAARAVAAPEQPEQPKAVSPKTVSSAPEREDSEGSADQLEVAGVKTESSESSTSASRVPPVESPCGCNSSVEYTEPSEAESWGSEEEWEPESEEEEWGGELEGWDEEEEWEPEEEW